MTRKKLIAGNHKMHTTLSEGLQLAKGIHNTLKDQVKDIDVLLIPPSTHLFAVSGVLKNTSFLTGAQNCAAEKTGAFTGEISAEMLVSVGASFVLIGHSERREIFGETSFILSKKIEVALKSGLNIIFCFGETLLQRESNMQNDVIENQLEILKALPFDAWKQISLAYEPVWAIGTGKTATSEQAQEIHAFTRNWLSNNVSASVAEQTRILYGGSVKPENAHELLSQPDIDGALVGGASLNIDSFSAIVHAALL